MAPLSVLPGRLRFESVRLKGRRALCRSLADALQQLGGVREASASFRTGRVLVRFDEQVVGRRELTALVAEVLEAEEPGSRAAERSGPEAARPSGYGVSGQIGRHILVDLLTHALLPKPLDLLLPPAMAALRR